jgi:hypothetical protein
MRQSTEGHQWIKIRCEPILASISVNRFEELKQGDVNAPSGAFATAIREFGLSADGC